MPENGVTAPTKDMQGIEVYIKGSIPLDLGDKAFTEIQRINDSALLIDSELSGALFGVGDKGKAPSITGNVDDIKKGGLVSVIPNGFLLLHNDLVALSSPEAKKDESEGSGGKLSFLSDFVKGFAGAAGVAAGAAAAMALFNSGEGTSESLKGVIADLDADISADDYKDDPEVASIKREAVLGYLRMYYTSQTASLAGDAIGNTLSSAVTSFVAGVAGDLFNALLGREDDPAATSLEAIATTLDSSVSMDELGLEEGGEYRELVVAEKRKATASYLAAYYIGQIANLAATDAASTFSDVAGELVGGTLRKIYEKLKGKEEDATSLESFVSTLDSSMGMEELGIAEGGEHREIVRKEKRLATIAYLAAYYTGQVASLATDSIASAASGFAAELVGGTLRKVFDKIRGKEENPSSLESFISILDSSIGMNELGLDNGGSYREVVLAEKRKATAAYLSEYYNSQIRGLASESVASAISDFALELVTGTIGKIFGKRKSKEEDATSLEALATSLDASMTMEDLGLAPGGANRDRVLGVQSDAVTEYLKAYYSAQVNSLTKDLDSSTAGSSVATTVKSFFSSLFDKKSGSIDPFLESLKTITQNLGADMDISKFSYSSNPAVRDAIDSSVGEYLTELLNKEKDALIDSIDNRALKTAAKEALAKVNLDLSPLASLSLPKYSIATEEVAEDEATSAATTYDDRNVLKKLDDIVANLEALLGAFQKNIGNTTVINAGGEDVYSIDEEFRIQ